MRCICREAAEKYNAVVDVCFEEALQAAQAADAAIAAGTSDPSIRHLEGVPVSVKDSIVQSGYYCGNGMASRCVTREREDSPLVTLLRDAGAIPVYRTNVPQCLMVPESDNDVYGRTTHHLNAGRTPGGSSGGEGVVVASKCSVLGLGTDIGGSLRIPGHFTGVTAFKPTPSRLTFRGTRAPRRLLVNGNDTIRPAAGPVGE